MVIAMDRLDYVLKQFPSSEKEHRKIIASKFGVNKLNDLEGSYLFGAKELGKKFSKIFTDNNVTISGFVDNDSRLWGTNYQDLPVISPTELQKINNPRVIITSRYLGEINNQLAKLGISNILPHYIFYYLFPKTFPNAIHSGAIKSILSSKEKIRKAYGLLSDKESKNLFLNLIEFRLKLEIKNLPRISRQEEYFPGKFWKLTEDEVFVDVGAYSGDTLKAFLKHKDNFKRYIAIEPDKKNYDDLSKSIPLGIKSKVETILAGAGNKNGVVNFSGFGRDDSLVTTEGAEEIKIIKLDTLYSDLNKKITTVKIDVEGYEPEVICGMKNILNFLKPKMAICVYHRPNHLWDLPFLLLKQNRSYNNFYLRHHENELYGTVLYSF